MVGQPFNPDQCAFLLGQSLNANQFNPNVPDTGNLIPHNLLWNFVENKIQWVDTRTNLIVQELGAGAGNDDFEKIVLVDAVFGNDATAVLYNQSLPFQTIDAAIAAAQDGDLIVVNPNTAPYNVFSNMFSPGISFYLNKGVTLNVFLASVSGGASNINILGYGDINWISPPTLTGTYSGDCNIQCNNFTLNGTFSAIGSFSGDIQINCNLMTLNAFFYYENNGYWPIATSPTNVTIKANDVVCNTILFFIYPATVNMNINVGSFTMANTVVPAIWNYGSGAPTYKVTSRLNIDKADVDRSSGFSWPLYNFVTGNSNCVSYITGQYQYRGRGVAADRSALIVFDGSAQTVYFDGVANITDGSFFLDLSGSGVMVVNGRVNVNNPSVTSQNYTLSTYFVSSSRLILNADTVVNDAYNYVVQMGDYSSSLNTSQVDINDCQIVNTSLDPLTASPTIGKAFNAFGGSTPGWGILRLKNAKVINIATTIAGGSLAEPVEVYTCYANTPQISIANTIAGTAIITDPAITSNNF